MAWSLGPASTTDVDLALLGGGIRARLRPGNDADSSSVAIDRLSISPLLVAFGLPETKLAEFDIDITGFSPQVAAELGDPDYLDPLKVNRRFIILTPEQDSLPVVHTSFSNTAGLMHEFFAAKAGYQIDTTGILQENVCDPG